MDGWIGYLYDSWLSYKGTQNSRNIMILRQQIPEIKIVFDKWDQNKAKAKKKRIKGNVIRCWKN